jgi:hypothetical protein
MWDGNSIQDTALYILMNLAISHSTRPYLNEHNVGKAVSLVAKYSCSSLITSTSPNSNSNPSSVDNEEKQKDLQCLKAVRCFEPGA